MNIRYVLKDKNTGEIHFKWYSIKQIEEGVFFLFDIGNYDIISRDRHTNQEDSEGEHIYENDIIQRHLGNSVTTSIIVYCERHSALVRQRIGEYRNGMDDGNYDFLDKKTISSNIGFKIIGDKHKTPELLK